MQSLSSVHGRAVSPNWWIVHINVHKYGDGGGTEWLKQEEHKGKEGGFYLVQRGDKLDARGLLHVVN